MAELDPNMDQSARFKSREPNITHYGLAAHINALNLARNDFLPGVAFGDPIWAITLDLFVSEHLERSTNISDLAERLNLSVSVCQRSVQYLVDKSAVFENTNAFTNPVLPVLLSEESKGAICDWLDSCTVESAQS